jgi:hypothetical protein
LVYSTPPLKEVNTFDTLPQTLDQASIGEHKVLENAQALALEIQDSDGSISGTTSSRY